MYYVYAHINKVNLKIYIGITANPARRWLHNGKNYYTSTCFYAAIKKYGWDKFEHVILKNNLSKKEAFDIERYLISLHRNDSYNIADGGNCGPVLFGERNPNYHKVRSEEHCKKLAESLKGHYVSTETKQKIKENNKMKRTLMCVKTKEIFNSITEAAEKYNTFTENIWRAVSGKRKSWHGLHFVYTDVS